MLTLAAVLVGLGVILILAGLFVFLQGVGQRARQPEGLQEDAPEQAQPGVAQLLTEYMKQCLTVLFDKTSSPSEIRMAAGCLVMLLGAVLFLAGVIPLLIAIIGAEGGSAGSSPTSTSAS